MNSRDKARELCRDEQCLISKDYLGKDCESCEAIAAALDEREALTWERAADFIACRPDYSNDILEHLMRERATTLRSPEPKECGEWCQDSPSGDGSPCGKAHLPPSPKADEAKPQSDIAWDCQKHGTFGPSYLTCALCASEPKADEAKEEPCECGGRGYFEWLGPKKGTVDGGPCYKCKPQAPALCDDCGGDLKRPCEDCGYAPGKAGEGV
jgi:hypothetical protein